MTEFGLALNVHLKTSAIISKSYDKLLSLVCDILNLRDECDLERGATKQMLHAANKIIRHLKIVTKHGKREITYTIDGLVEKTPKSAEFENRDGKTNAHDYFLKSYNIKLQQLPMVRTSGRKSVLIPLELALLRDSQFLNKTKFDQNIQRELLFKSTHQPNVYFHKVAKIVDRIKESDSDGILGKFGMDITPKAARIEGRVLPAPRTQGSNNRDRFVKADKSPSWGIFCFDDRQFQTKDLHRFAEDMINNAKRFGLRLDEPTFADVVPIKSIDDIIAVFHNVMKRTNVEMVFVGIPNRKSLQSFYPPLSLLTFSL